MGLSSGSLALCVTKGGNFQFFKLRSFIHAFADFFVFFRNLF